MLRPETPAEDIPFIHREDHELVRLSASGSREAFEVLWARHRLSALYAVRPLAKSDTEDVVAEAYAEIWQQLQRGSAPPQHFKNYLIQVSKNLASKHYRERQHTVTGLELEVLREQPLAPSSAALIDSRDQRRHMIAAFRSLPKRWQQVLWLTTVERLPRRNVAAALELGLNTVSAIAVRAKEGLRIAWLEQHLPPPERIEHEHIVSSLPKYTRKGLSHANTDRISRHLTSCNQCSEIAEHLSREDQRLRKKRGAVFMITTLTAAGATIKPTLPAAATISALPAMGFSAKVQGFITQGGSMFIAAGTAGVVGLSVAVSAALNPGVVQDVIPEHTDPTVPLTAPSGESSTEASMNETEPAGPGDVSTTETLSESIPLQFSEPVRDAHVPVEPLPGTHPPSKPEVAHPVPAHPPSPPTTDDTLPEADPETELEVPFTLHPVSTAPTGVPPLLTGTAPAGSSIHVSVADHAFRVETAENGEWQVDLAQLLLPAGSHTVSLTPEPGGETVYMSVDFIHPTLEYRSGEWRAEIHGAPNSTVCLESPFHPGVELTLNDEGWLPLGFVHVNWHHHITLRYCDGDRYGPLYEAPRSGSPVEPWGTQPDT